MMKGKKWAIGPRFHRDLEEGIGWWIDDEDGVLAKGFTSLDDAEKFFQQLYAGEEMEFSRVADHGCNVLYQHGEVDLVAWEKQNAYSEEARVFQYEEEEEA